MNHSDRAWNFSSKIIDLIKSHPFNQELMRGVLPKDKFSYYIQQDAIYLKEYSRSLAILASKMPAEYISHFLRYASNAFIVEQTIIHKFFQENLNLYKPYNAQELSPATFSYTNYLLQVCSIQPVEVGIAAILPCFWIYYEVGSYVAKNSSKKNRYKRWIDNYSGEDFLESVNEVIEIYNIMADKASSDIQQKMLNAFYNSSCLEWHFWNDSYNHSKFDDIRNI
ncbi:Thiaminase-2 [Rickettsiales bacterium Ac37b]|nr:Thiaminase-2 [Rickettsiales bacterium Ac37b]